MISRDVSDTLLLFSVEKKMARSQQKIEHQKSEATLLGKSGTGNAKVDARMVKKFGADQK